MANRIPIQSHRISTCNIVGNVNNLLRKMILRCHPVIITLFTRSRWQYQLTIRVHCRYIRADQRYSKAKISKFSDVSRCLLTGHPGPTHTSSTSWLATIQVSPGCWFYRCQQRINGVLECQQFKGDIRDATDERTIWTSVEYKMTSEQTGYERA